MHRLGFATARFALLSVVCLATDVFGVRAGEESPPAGVWPPQIKQTLPPTAKPLPDDVRKRLEARLAEVRDLQKKLPFDVAKSWAWPDEYQDVRILLKAVDFALRNHEFFDHKKDVAKAEQLLALAAERIELLAQNKAPWRKQTGVTVLGYGSDLDDSAQPYALVVPEKLDRSKRVPLYIWLHGRGDTSCDLQFIANFLGSKVPGALQPTDGITIHAFGRYCNGFKSAGEIDVLKCVARGIGHGGDPNRVVIAGFSMGGAGAWHLGAHYADKWCAVHAGAGFVDVKRYQNITPDKLPPWYVQKLWGLYDVPDYRRNLLNVPLVAYSGEVDKQKAAADIMEGELAGEGLEMTHLIGPGMGHKYHPEQLADVQRRLSEFAAKGRERFPQKVSLQTRTLRYNRMHWIEALRLENHWEDSRIDAEIQPSHHYVVATKNVNAFQLDAHDARVLSEEKPRAFPAGAKFTIDRQEIDLPSDFAERRYESVQFRKNAGKWELVVLGIDHGPDVFPPRKSHELQGPIDDAFMRRFNVVLSKPSDDSSLVDRWASFESTHLIDRWRLLMRGEPIVLQSDEIDMTSLDQGLINARPKPIIDNVVLWGTPATNPMIARLLDKLPLKWNDKTVGMGDLEFDSSKVVPVLIYPNPLDPSHYVVINSGLTFREAHDRTNSQQNPKLPDWAFVDVTQPPTDELPGKILAAGFFDEDWKYVPQPPADATELK